MDAEVGGAVYGIADVDGNIVYVGVTVGSVDERYRQHLGHARRGDIDRPLYAWLRENESRIFTLEMCITDERLAAAEKNWIEYLPNLLNKTIGGNRGARHSDETRAKMSAAQKARRQSLTPAQEAEFSSRVGEKNAFYGRRHSDETKARIRLSRASQVVRPHSDETKAKMAAARRAYWEKWRADRGRV